MFCLNVNCLADSLVRLASHVNMLYNSIHTTNCILNQLGCVIELGCVVNDIHNILCIQWFMRYQKPFHCICLPETCNSNHSNVHAQFTFNFFLNASNLL